MLPLSLGRAVLAGSQRTLPAAPSWQRPGNMASANARERRALSAWTWVIVAVGVFVALGYVWLHLKVAESGYRLEATRQAVERLHQEANDLTVEAASFDSPARLEAVAQARLGMRRVQKGQEAILP